MVLHNDGKTESSKQRNVAVIFQGRVRDTSTAEDFDGLQQAFQREGYGTMLYVADGMPEKESQIIHQLASEGVPGVVLYSSHPVGSDAHLQHALQAGMKVVVYDHDFPKLDCNFVGIDDHLAAYEATEHLVRLGCGELLLINSERDWTTHTLRQQGFVEAARKWNVAQRVVQIPNCGDPARFDEYIRAGLAPLRQGARRQVGILAWWDEVALRAIRCLRDMGLSVPADAKVVGFANDRSGALAEIPLTTMEIPREEIARLAATALVNQMRDPTRPAQRIRLKARMIIRQSCGTYANAAGADVSATADRPAAFQESPSEADRMPSVVGT